MTALADPETALRQIATTADVFEAGGGTWLLAPAPPQLVDTLAALGAADDDREPDDAPEVDAPPEVGDHDEANGDQEPDEPDEASHQIAAKVISEQMASVGMGHYSPGASYDWEPEGTKAGKL